MLQVKRWLSIFLLIGSINIFGQNALEVLPDWDFYNFEPLSIHLFDDTIDLVPVIGGSFTMGSKLGEDNNKPAHLAHVDSFYMSKYEVTFDLYDAYCIANSLPLPYDGSFGRGKYPVINIDWYEAMDFCKWLSKETGLIFRLPTEAEWEYAARGGQLSKKYEYAGSDDQEDVCWYSQNSQDSPHQVGLKAPNELGLYDMSGNVWEWCLDVGRKYTELEEINPKGDTTGNDFRSSRGGSWGFYPQYCRVYFRDKYRSLDSYSDLGIRLLVERQTIRPKLQKMLGSHNLNCRMGYPKYLVRR